MTTKLRQDPMGRFAVVYEPGLARLPLLSGPGNGSADGGEQSVACPFCPGNERYCQFSIDQFGEKKDWKLRVIPNRLPFFSVEGGEEAFPDGIYDINGGAGAHEVIIESPEHGLTPFAFTQAQWCDIFTMTARRLTDLRQDSRFQYVSFFRNFGVQAGAALSHPHSQILALPLVPPEVQQKLRAFHRHQEHKGRCLACDIVHHETSARKRILAENESFVAMAPYASRHPFEMHVYPRRHQGFFESMNPEEQVLFSRIIADLMQKLQRVLAEPPFHMILFNRPVPAEGSRFHWHMEILPRVFAATALQEGTGIYMNPVTPEEVVKVAGSRPAQGFDDQIDDNGIG